MVSRCEWHSLLTGAGQSNVRVGSALLQGAGITGSDDPGQGLKYLVDCVGIDRGKFGVQNLRPSRSGKRRNVTVVERALQSLVLKKAPTPRCQVATAGHPQTCQFQLTSTDDVSPY